MNSVGFESTGTSQAVEQIYAGHLKLFGDCNLGGYLCSTKNIKINIFDVSFLDHGVNDPLTQGF